MRARDHTRSMLAWWQDRVDRADLAVRRRDHTMIWTRDRALDRLPLGWARAENVRGAEIYIRPARGYDWPLVFLDDVPVETALRAASHYAALVVRTSPAGGCHLWLATPIALNEQQRRMCQQHLADTTGADPASTSGEHLGRLAGFRNHKRQGPWVNVLVDPADHPPWKPPPDLLDRQDLASPGTRRRAPQAGGGMDRSLSGQDWAWACRQLEAGAPPDRVRAILIERCRRRRGPDAERYARQTVERAARHVTS